MPDTQASIATDAPPEIIQVGRQPILDRQLETYGYELLYRADDMPPSPDLDGNLATARTVLNTFLEFGLQRLAGDSKVFINLTRAFFTQLEPLPLDRKRLVLEVLEDIPVDDALVAGVRQMREAGHTLALDDYRFEARWDPLLPHVQMIKVDIQGLDLQEKKPQIEDLKARGHLLLAEKVETEEEFQHALALGFDLFQGYFFAKPQIISGRRLQSNQQLLLQLIARINDPACDIDELAELVGRDPKLSFKILRFINSAAIGLPKMVASIHQAVVMIGLQRLRAWATLFGMASISGKAPELVTTGLVRAELCHDLAATLGDAHADSGYTVGLLSVLDALLDRPMEELVKDIPLSPEMIEGLANRTGPYGRELQCALALEEGRWLEPEAQLLPLDRLNPLFIRALTRAEEIRQALHA